MLSMAPEHPLRRWRKSEGLTLAEAGQKIGTSRQVWWGWETGRRRPNRHFMPKVRALTCGKVKADDFFSASALAEPQLVEAA